MKIFTIGFTKSSAEFFFTRLLASGARRLVDLRLKNDSQLAGFAKKTDLPYFLKVICHMDYIHLTELAPTSELLQAYQKKGGDWRVYENEFLELIKSRKVDTTLSRDLLADSCLLCSEDTPDRCHRRLVAEYFRDHWGDIEIVHL